MFRFDQAPVITTEIGATVSVRCECGCGIRFDARTADRKRGWGRFATKSCKARARRTGQE